MKSTAHNRSPAASLEDTLCRIDAALLPGGPEVDVESIVAIVQSELFPDDPRLLSPEEQKIVEENIRLYRDWHRAYCEALAFVPLDSGLGGEDTPTNKASGRDGVVQSWQASNAAVRRTSHFPPVSLPLNTGGAAKELKWEFTVSPEQCEWDPAASFELPEANSLISATWRASGILTLTVSGFLFASGEYFLDAVWASADSTEQARGSVLNPYAPSIELSSLDKRPPVSGDKILLTSRYVPATGSGWTASLLIVLL